MNVFAIFKEIGKYYCMRFFFFAGIYVCLLIQYLYIYSKYVYVVVSVAVVVVVHLSIHCRDTHAVKAIIWVHVTGKIDSSD